MAIASEESAQLTTEFLVRGTRYSALPIMFITGLHDLYLAEGTTNGDRFRHLQAHAYFLNGVNHSPF